MLWEAVNYITAYGEVYSIQFYVIKFVSDCWFYLVIRFPPTLRLAIGEISLKVALIIYYNKIVRIRH